MDTKLKIINGRTFCADGSFSESTVYCVNDRIVAEETYAGATGTEQTLDAAGRWVIPGLMDIHFHGCMGSDCCDGTEEAFRTMASYELSQGVTSITPATMTMSEEVLSRICRTVRDFSYEDGADLCGLYMEGPFISREKKGAQNERYIIPADTALLERLQTLSGNKILTVVVAPETEGAMDFIRENSSKINISLAHMTADYDTAMEAFSCGARELTHLFNAMPPLIHRSPGPIGAGADCEHCMAELICDGIHVHPASVRAAFKLFTDQRIILISDSMRAAGMADGTYDLGGQEVTVKGNLAVLADGTIAGSVTNLMDCVRTAVNQMGIPLGSAVKCASHNPAKAVGLQDEYGSLEPGHCANIVLLNEDLGLNLVIHRGKIISH